MKIFFLIFILLILNNELESDILVQQIPDTLFPLGVLCQKDSVFPFNSEACDDILITLNDWRLDSVTTWWLTGSGFVSWAEVSNIRLKIYPDSGINPPMPRDSSIYLTIIENSQISVIPLSQDIWRVTIELPDSYCLNFNQRFWVTVQPSNIFGSNGKTFWIADTGIGNGFSGYYRCSTLGYPQWTGINTVFQQDYEMGMIIWGETVNHIEEYLFDQPQQNEIIFTYLGYEKLQLHLELFSEAEVSLGVYDMVGRMVGMVEYGRLGRGNHIIEWNTAFERDQKLPSGIYFYTLAVEKNIFTGKFPLIR
ncbi:MAG: hypothetical protein APR63_10145 [Desulfuromonas sp. SDB]|nr:MAG: hypothetical protein APR63_10145 [Desulfuromonas sp. SDB]